MSIVYVASVGIAIAAFILGMKRTAEVGKRYLAGGAELWRPYARAHPALHKAKHRAQSMTNTLTLVKPLPRFVTFTEHVCRGLATTA